MPRMSSKPGKQLPVSWRWPDEETRRKFNSKIAAEGLKGQQWFEGMIRNFISENSPIEEPKGADDGKE